MPSFEAKLDEIFKYHSPTPDDTLVYEALRAAAKVFAKVVLDSTPMCADQSAAIRLIREALMTANASIALKGLV